MVEADARVWPGDVVDDLHEDVPGGPGHDQARTLGGAADLLAHPDVAARARGDACRLAPRS